MSKFNKKCTVSAKGILSVNGDIIAIENTDTGELIPVATLLDDFDGRDCSITVAYAEDID